MRFECEGQMWDTSDLAEFHPRDLGILSIYVSKDHRHVFVLTFNRWSGVNVHRAASAEIGTLAERFRHMPALRAALSQAHG